MRDTGYLQPDRDEDRFEVFSRLTPLKIRVEHTEGANTVRAWEAVSQRVLGRNRLCRKRGHFKRKDEVYEMQGLLLDSERDKGAERTDH